jgi:hypothetical protein
VTTSIHAMPICGNLCIKINSTSTKTPNALCIFAQKTELAVAYAIALGLNTVYYHSNSQLLILYTSNLHKHTKGDFLHCKPMAFREEKVSKYKTLLQRTYEVYHSQTALLQERLLTMELNTNKDILSHITNIYEYSLLEEMILPFRTYQTMIDTFQSRSRDLTEIEKDMIVSLYYRAKHALSDMEGRDLNHIIRFPHLESVCPISSLLVIQPSDIYISTLLRALMHENVHMINGMKKCIHRILELSAPSEHRSFHYGVLLDHLATFRLSGGRVHSLPKNEIHLPKQTPKSMYSLGLFYLEYLSIYLPELHSRPQQFPRTLNYYEIGHKKLTMEYDYMIVYECMEQLVKQYGIFKEEFHDLTEAIYNYDL